MPESIIPLPAKEDTQSSAFVVSKEVGLGPTEWFASRGPGPFVFT
jgi:hypothetical protein